MELLGKIINSFHKIPGKGLPLGNVTSQIFANIYMNLFDWYVKRELMVKYYIRYCDDFVILSLSQQDLVELLPLLQEFLLIDLKLELHPDKVFIRKFHQGIDFLGAVFLPHHTILRTKTKQRIIKKSYELLKQVQTSKLSKERVSQSLVSYLGHLSHTKSRALTNTIVKIRIQLCSRWTFSGQDVL
jgi:hypothetical protein